MQSDTSETWTRMTHKKEETEEEAKLGHSLKVLKDLRQIRLQSPGGELVYSLSPTKQSSFFVRSVRPMCLRLQGENLSLFSCTSLLA